MEPPKTPKAPNLQAIRSENESLPELLHEELTGEIRQIAFDIHEYFGSGFLEKVYEGALENRLRKSGLDVFRQTPIDVKDEDGTVVGHYTADLLINRLVLLEIKAVQRLDEQHKAQLLNYLKATGIQVGLLINFGGRTLQFKRVVL